MANIPRYEQLTQLLREKLVSGEFRVGDRFHSQNELMKKYRLSFATVTRALNDLERQGLLVREQGRGTFVRSLIPAATTEPMAEQHRAAVFMPWDTRNPVHVNFRRLYKGLESARPTDFHLKVIPYSNDPADVESFLFSRERMDGVIFVYPGEQHKEFIQKLAQSLPVVVVGRQIEHRNVSCVSCDNAAAADEAVSHLIAAGHMSIGMISGALEMTDSRERLEGYRRALERAEITFDESLVAYTDPVELNGFAAASELLARPKGSQVTAIFAAGDLIAMGAMAAMRNLGRSAPDHISVMGFDDVETAAAMNPPLTTVHVPMEEMARRAMELLVDLNGGGKPTIEVMPARIVRRESVASPVPALS